MDLYTEKHTVYKPKVLQYDINEKIPTQKKDEKVVLFNIF